MINNSMTNIFISNTHFRIRNNNMTGSNLSNMLLNIIKDVQNNDCDFVD